jgi:toxin ParE1/3/4
LHATIVACAERISEFPYLYRAGRAKGTREAVVHPNYIVIYEVGADSVTIRSVIHSRRQYPPED